MMVQHLSSLQSACGIRQEMWICYFKVRQPASAQPAQVSPAAFSGQSHNHLAVFYPAALHPLTIAAAAVGRSRWSIPGDCFHGPVDPVVVLKSNTCVTPDVYASTTSKRADLSTHVSDALVALNVHAFATHEWIGRRRSSQMLVCVGLNIHVSVAHQSAHLWSPCPTLVWATIVQAPSISASTGARFHRSTV